MAAYLVRSRACTEDEEDPERLVALERILKSVGRGKRQKTALETQGGDVEHVDPLEEILRERAAEDASNLDGEADEDERGYQSPVYLSDDHHSLVGSDEDPEHDNAQWRKSRYPHFNPKNEVPDFCKSMVLIDAQQFRDAVRKHSIIKKKDLN